MDDNNAEDNNSDDVIPFEDLVFVGFNSRVLALHRDTGEIVWHWLAPKPRTAGFVTLLLDGDRLIVSVNGYMYCLHPETGEQLWYNGTRGHGTGVASIVSARGYAVNDTSAMAAAQADQAAAAGS